MFITIVDSCYNFDVIKRISIFFCKTFKKGHCKFEMQKGKLTMDIYIRDGDYKYVIQIFWPKCKIYKDMSYSQGSENFPGQMSGVLLPAADNCDLGNWPFWGGDNYRNQISDEPSVCLSHPPPSPLSSFVPFVRINRGQDSSLDTCRLIRTSAKLRYFVILDRSLLMTSPTFCTMFWPQWK